MQELRGWDQQDTPEDRDDRIRDIAGQAWLVSTAACAIVLTIAALHPRLGGAYAKLAIDRFELVP